MTPIIVNRDAATVEFFDGLRQRQFLLIRDRTSGLTLDVQASVPDDPERFERYAASGLATVISSSIVHSRLPDGSSARRQVGIVALDEGPWWWTHLATDGDLLPVGARVSAAFDLSGVEHGGEAVVHFVPLAL